MSFTVKHVVRLLLVLIVGTLAINFWIGLNNKNVNESNNVAGITKQLQKKKMLCSMHLKELQTF